jgi:hypothetical protein
MEAGSVLVAILRDGRSLASGLLRMTAYHYDLSSDPERSS